MDLAKAKSNLKLDLYDPSKQRKNIQKQELSCDELNPISLSTPDINLFTMSTPDIAKFLLAQSPSSTIISTPSQIILPKSVTEEQEAYARGFVEALFKLQSQWQQQQQPQLQLLENTTVTSTTITPENLKIVESEICKKSHKLPKHNTIKDNNLYNQDEKRVIRRREKNRYAAQQCRMRKLEKIARLEARKDELLSNIYNLSNILKKRADEVSQVEEFISLHAKNGCNLFNLNG